ncbi:hypothetical protein B0T20DRAFT_342825 [Sordaria brevicollis]|uniref:DUF4219 domain-containing protein n=1 Tax=Sordaria brevicollis TaxID=83679 RepID=A0AAE0PML1_SORBR|nr:hypothetical protein B0T20DRAFT_342825 [Sordaria brevicollis]
MYDSSSDEEHAPEIPALRGEKNFQMWKFFAERYLQKLGLDGFIKGTEKPPVGNTPEDVKTLLAKFHGRKFQAWNVIYTSLQRWYYKIGPFRQRELLKELTNIDYRQFKGIDALLDRAVYLQQRLGGLNMPISDEMMKTCLFGGLIQHPSRSLQTLLVAQYDELDLQGLISRIRQHTYIFDRQADEYQREQQEANRPRNNNGQSSGHRGGSRRRGRR